MKFLNKIFFIALSTNLINTQAYTQSLSGVDTEAKASANFEIIVTNYVNKKRNTREVNDMSILCIGEIMGRWVDAYDRIVKVKLPQAYQRLGGRHKAIEAIANRDNVDHVIFRDFNGPDFIPLVIEVMGELENDSIFTLPNGLTFDDVQEAALIQNLNSCANPQFVDEVNARRSFDPNELLASNRTVDYTTSRYSVDPSSVGEASSASTTRDRTGAIVSRSTLERRAGNHVRVIRESHTVTDSYQQLLKQIKRNRY